MIMMSGRVGWKARARLVGGNPKLFLFQVQLRRPTTILLMIAHLGKIPTLRKTSLISASICTNARASGQSNVFTKPKKIFTLLANYFEQAHTKVAHLSHLLSNALCRFLFRKIQSFCLIFFRFICFRQNYLKCTFTFSYIFGCKLIAGP